MIFSTPSTRILKCRAAMRGSRTSLTKLSMTTTVRRCTSILRSLRARNSKGTRTANAGAVTSTTNVVDASAFMQFGTEDGFDMHSTRIGICLSMSALPTAEHKAVAHFLAAVETCSSY